MNGGDGNLQEVQWKNVWRKFKKTTNTLVMWLFLFVMNLDFFINHTVPIYFYMSIEEWQPCISISICKE